ncbi:MAG: FecR family protein [Elusimicrobia bacterium]|nr:FecR family protein [Elusimicrobiota bacterium]
MKTLIFTVLSAMCANLSAADNAIGPRQASVTAADAPSKPGGEQVGVTGGVIGCIYNAGRNAELMKAGPASLWQPVKKAMPIAEGDRIKTGPRGNCEILIKDGTFIKVDERSELTASELKLDAAGRKYSFAFLAGKAMWLAAKFKSDLASKIEVRTPSAVCAVRGTAFSVALSSQNTSVGLFEGVLAVTAGAENKEIAQGSEADVSGGSLAVQPHLSRLMEGERKTYNKLKNRVEDLRKKLAKREDFIDSFLAEQDKKVSDYKKRQAEKLKQRGK